MDRHYRGGLQACRYVVIVEMGRQAAWWIAVNMHQTGLRLSRKCRPVLKSSYLFLVFSSRSHLAHMSHSPYTSLRDRLSDHIVLAHAMHTVRLPVCTTHDEAWWCSHRRRVHASPDLCKSMQDKVYATCQGDTMRHPRGFAGQSCACLTRSTILRSPGQTVARLWPPDGIK